MWDSKRDIDVKNSLLDTVEEGEGGMVWSGSIETCILSFAKQMSDSMHETGFSRLVHWDDPGWWDGEGGGRAALGGEHMCTWGLLMSIFGKNHYNILR